MKKNATRLSREELIQKAGAASLASLVVGASAGTPAEADPTIFSGPWNLSLSRLSPKPQQLTKAENSARKARKPRGARRADDVEYTPIDLVLVFHNEDDIFTPNGFTLYAVYFVGIGTTDQPVYIYGADENGKKEDDGNDNPRKLGHPYYIAMYTHP